MRQVGPYLLRAEETREASSLVREDWEGRTSGVPVVALAAALGSQRAARINAEGI